MLSDIKAEHADGKLVKIITINNEEITQVYLNGVLVSQTVENLSPSSRNAASYANSRSTDGTTVTETSVQPRRNGCTIS